MNIISKLLLGVGSKEDIKVTPYKILQIAILLGVAFFSAVALLLIIVSKLI
jgi:hypothetical protein